MKMIADKHSARFTTVRNIAPPMDTGFDDEYPQGSILHCLACGSLFLRHSSRQRYCQSADCQAERNRRNRRAGYARHRNDGEDSANLTNHTFIFGP